MAESATEANAKQIELKLIRAMSQCVAYSTFVYQTLRRLIILRPPPPFLPNN